MGGAQVGQIDSAEFVELSFGRWRRQLHLVIALRELASGATVQRVSSDLG